MAGKIFINYRRGDDPGFTQALFSRLEQVFPVEELFIDVDHVPAGEDFVRVLESQVAQCDVMLAVIGKEWLSVTDERGNRRLDDPHDFVRVEIESALKQNKRVIPILVHEARMPHPDELPETLKALSRRNAVRLTHERFKGDVQGLIKALQQALEAAESDRRALAEAVQQATVQEERRRQEEAARERERARREEEERVRQAKEEARLNAIAGLSAEQIAKAEELANWDFIKDSPQPQDFRDHLARFPGGVCERMARRRLAALVWQGLGASPPKSALQSYIEEFPDSTHSEQAKALFVSLDRAEAERTSRLRITEQQAFDQAKRQDCADVIAAFLSAHPESHLAAEARELHASLLRRDQMHKRALTADDPAMLRSFLKQYPSGAPADEVRRRLRRMEAPPPRGPLNKPILLGSALLLLVLAAGGVWLAALQGPPQAPGPKVPPVSEPTAVAPQAPGPKVPPVSEPTAVVAAYPTRAVRLVVGFAPGGPSDIFARLVGQGLAVRLGQPLVVENKPGAASNVAAAAIAKDAPDGYSLLVATSTNAINASLYENLGFNFVRDIAPVAGIIRTPLLVLVSPSVQAKTIPEFIAYAKANPGKLNVASSGNGTMSHMAYELFKMMTGANMVHVPFRGEAPAIADLIAGNVQVMFGSGPVALPLVMSGKLRALAVTTATRWNALPDVPTVADAVIGYEASIWNGVGAPRNTPGEIADKLNREINAVLADSKTKQRLADMGGTVAAMSVAEFGKFIGTETEKWAKVVRFSGAKAIQ